jgi:hypothetical protein
MTSTLWAQRQCAKGDGVYASDDAAIDARGYNSSGSVKLFRSKRKAEAWVNEVAQRPSKRPRPIEPVRIVCDGVSVPGIGSAVGIYAGPDDPRNVSARIVGYVQWPDLDSREESDPFYAAVSAVYAAVKRAPPTGKVVVETPWRLIVDYVERICYGRQPNWYVDKMVMSIKHLLHVANRRIRLVYVARRKSEHVQKATDMAFAALGDDALHAAFPKFPLAEDTVTPWLKTHFDEDRF